MKTPEDEAFDELAKKQGAWGGGYQAKKAMAANKLQEPAQEPVALVIDGVLVKSALPEKYTGHLYTTPAQPAQKTKREWVGLTDEEIGKQTILAGFNPEWKIEIGMVFSIVRNLEAKLKEKNA
jgi:carbamate kinase